MDYKNLIGMRVLNNNTHAIGTIQYIENGKVCIDFHGTQIKYAFPEAFSGLLELEDETVQDAINNEAIEASFDTFKRTYKHAVYNEIDFLKATGGKKYRIIDGEKIPTQSGDFLYAFDTDTDLHFPDGTVVKLWISERVVLGYVVSCEDFSILIRTSEYIGESIESVELSAEQWQLLEALMERLDEMEPESGTIAYEVACSGKRKKLKYQEIKCGQNLAFNRATTENITFIWGPPGTGKTETLANIALEHIKSGRRVLMLSYSNVSVDGATLRVAKKSDLPAGKIIRYGYPRSKEMLESKTLTSYQYVLHENPETAKEYHELLELKKGLKRKDPRRIEVNKKINKFREKLLKQEHNLIQNTSFLATTVSKATVDMAVYSQMFDVVIFDEASMAYVPQIVFSASMARSFFVCLGDFCQLPAIVQNNTDSVLERDIFEYTGISEAVENDQGHEWLVMLDMQYRMHSDIADFVSERMYGGRLKTSERIFEGRNEIAKCTPCEESAMALVDLGGMYSVCNKTMDGSRINLLSALVSLRIAEMNINRFEIGIITPYNAQSRLLLSMIRDIQEYDKRWENVACATVHQFQGSEKPIIIYDSVDCYRMPYPGTLLTSTNNDTANRLFNVALTRAKGKFVLVSNVDYMIRKKISKNLMFTRAIKQLRTDYTEIKGVEILDELMPTDDNLPIVYFEDRETSWEEYLKDVGNAKIDIHVDVPDVIKEDDSAIKTLSYTLKRKKKEGVSICIRTQEDIDLPRPLQAFVRPYSYVTTPVTIIDKQIIWFGHPLYAADFISEGEILDTEVFPCVRFVGKHAARSIKAFLEI